MMIFWRLMLIFFLRQLLWINMPHMRALKEGAKVLASTTLVLNRDDLKTLSNELGISTSKNKIPDRLDLNLTEFCAYYDHLATVRIKFTNTAKRYFSKLIGSENRYTTQVFKICCYLEQCKLHKLISRLFRKYYSLNPVRVNPSKFQLTN